MSNDYTLSPVFTNTYNLKDCCKYEDKFDYKDTPDMVIDVKQELLNEDVSQAIVTHDKEFWLNEIVKKENENDFEDSGLVKSEENDIKYQDEQASMASHFEQKQHKAVQKSILKRLLLGHRNKTGRKRNLNRQLQKPKSPEEAKVFKCDTCDFITFYKHNYKTHLLKHKNPEDVDKFKCDQCSYQTVHKSDLNKHRLRHTKLQEVDLFKCEQCAFQTIDKRSLKRHLLQHKNPADVDMFLCNQCCYQTTTKINLKKHILRHKNIENAIFKCDQCDFKTNYKYSFKTHLFQHKSRERFDMFKCDQCHYRTDRRFNLNKHLRRHINPAGS